MALLFFHLQESDEEESRLKIHQDFGNNTKTDKDNTQKKFESKVMF